MAEVRLRFVRGAYNFAHKINNRYLLGSQCKLSKSAIQVSSSISAVDIKNGDLHGAGSAADGATVRVPQDSYTPGMNFCTFRPTHQQQSVGLCWGHHGQFVFIRAYRGNGPRSEPLYKTETGYYEILEVLPTATQAQIKTAYYKQSFIYHPDRNAGSEFATVRFSEISEAYTVLGNKALRKKYNLGLLSQSDLNTTARPSAATDTGSSTRRPTESRRSVVNFNSRGSVFEFDQFIKAHYNEQLQRDRETRLRREEMLRKKHETIEEKGMGRMMEMGILVLIAMAVGIMASLK